MKRLFLLPALLFHSGIFLLAGGISLPDAGKTAISFLGERISRFRPEGSAEITVQETFTVSMEEMAVYYAINISPSGYVIVSGDDRVKPVLAYSYDSRYDPENLPPQFIAWLKQYALQIRHAVKEDLPASPEIKKEWDRLLSGLPDRELLQGGGKSVEPLIFSTWNQNSPYNAFCPADPAGPGGHAYAGCVPTAMGQVMYYYRWPYSGTGSYSYEDPPYGILSVNYDSATYDWNSMSNSAGLENPAIAKLLYHLGVSCDLQYGPDGSGMYNHKAAYALRTFFKYSPETQYVYRDSTTLAWDSILIAHLDRKMPMYYAGWSVPNINGHAFVCDGYQGTDYFHFNFGWGGQADGYFYLDNLTPGGNNFNLAQEVIINCYPDTVNHSYPVYCTGSTELNSLHGSIEDGSGPTKDYQPGSSCSWLIRPVAENDSIKSITLSFNRFETDTAAQVTLYDGATESSPVLAVFSGNSVPPAITGTASSMLITFSPSGSSPGAGGWFATYSSNIPVWCSGMKTIVSDTADFSDGSNQFNYHNNSSCRWRLISASGNPLTIYFRSFDTEPENDFLLIFDPITKDTLAVVSGHYDSTNLPPPVTSVSDTMFLIFITNDSVTARGWEIYYPKSSAGTGETIPSLHMTIYPNPADNQVRVSWLSPVQSDFRISVWTLQGQLVSSREHRSRPGKNTLALDLSSLSEGIYFIEVQSSGSVARQKLVIHKP
jgi:hypothetical protein